MRKILGFVTGLVLATAVVFRRRHRSGASGAAPHPVSSPQSRAGGMATLREVLDRANAACFVGSCVAEPGGVLLCPACSERVGASEVRREWVERLEGASDPDDLLVVSGVRCPRCSAGSVYVSGYGPSASEDEADIAVVLPEPSGALASFR